MSIPGNGDDQPSGSQDAEPEVVKGDRVSVLPPCDLWGWDAVSTTWKGQLVVLGHNELLFLLLNSGRY